MIVTECLLRFDFPRKRICILLALLFFACGGEEIPFNPPKVEKGKMDIASVNHWGKAFPIRGDWEFSWNNLYSTSKGFPSSGKYYPVKGIWREYDPEYTMQGHGTYRVGIHSSVEQSNLAVLVPRLPGVYAVYLNGKQIFANGITGTSRASTEFFAHPGSRIFNIPSPEAELVVNVSNYKGNFLKGGIRSDFLLGDMDVLKSEIQFEMIRDTALIAILVAVGLYHLIFFISYRKDLTPLFFSLFCFLVAFYSFVTSGLQYLLTPGLPLDLRIRFEFFCEACLVPSVFLILRNMYPKQFGSKWMAIFMSTMGIFLLSTLLLGEEELIYVYAFFMNLPPIYAVFLIYALVRAWMDGEPRARTVFLSGMILAAGMMNDVIFGLYERYFLFPYSFPVTLVGFIAFNSYIISIRFTKDLEKAEKFAELQSKYNEQLRVNAEEKAKYASLVDQSMDKGLHSLIHQLESKESTDRSLTKLKSELNQTLSGVRDILDLMHHQGGKEELVEAEMRKYVASHPDFSDSEIQTVSNKLRIDQCLQIQRIFSDVIRMSARRGGPSKIFWGREGDSILLRIFMSGTLGRTEEGESSFEADLKARTEKLGARFFLLSEPAKFEFELRIQT
ncbi:7TM-DISM domain-containing protein [Leptospira wolffii]|uniref:7TM-DISM domain-containing protein n=1 Tax=Leptospira wolffii TaxID=409998 RepID=UPI001FAF104B|nr:7TM-DISM domain-containing protein [Leptospira wolffii]